MWARLGQTLLIGILAAACAAPTASSPAPGSGESSPRASGPSMATRPLDSQQAERLKRVMLPLIQAMDHPVPLDEVSVGLVDDPSINAANAGEGRFFVTRGLLEKAGDRELSGVLAHEIAHEDLGHVAKAQVLGAGLNIGAAVLEQIFPGSGVITPIAGQLIARGYSRREEYAADRHGAELLERTGQSRQVMIDTLRWLMQVSGPSSGGFFSTHPGTEDRIQALQAMK